MQSKVKERMVPLLGELNRTIELFVNMSKMVALKLERSVVATNDAPQDALVAAICRKLQFTHSLLQIVVRIRETPLNCLRVAGSTSDIILRLVRIDNGKLGSLVRNVCMGLSDSQ